MAIPTLITELSTTAAANSPAGSDSPSTLDDIQRAHASFIAQLRDADALKLDAAAVSAFGLTLIDDASAAAARTTLGVTPANIGAAVAGTLATSGITGAAASGANTDITSLGNIVSINGGQLAGMRNKIINGKMEIAQRGMSFPGLNNQTYTLDRFYWSPTTTSAIVTVSQQADAPSNNEFQSSLRVTITTADTSIPASDLVFAAQAIEGYNVRDLIGRTFTLSFWVRSSKVGIHCIGLRNSGSDRSYVAQYTINSANTWEQKSITVSGGLITAGTWNWTSGVGLLVQWALAAGTTFQTTAGAWQTGNFLATAAQVNCLDTIGNIFAITGVQLEVGTVATPFEHRPIGMELALCQRYFQRLAGAVRFPGIGGATVACTWHFKTSFRSNPTTTGSVGTLDGITTDSANVLNTSTDALWAAGSTATAEL